MICQYRNHLPVLYGAGSIALLGEKMVEMGCKKVMCVYDAGVQASGIIEKAKSSLNGAGVEYVVFDQFTPDPTDFAIDAGGEIARGEKVEAIIGIGGGSSMDAAKAIALLLDHDPPIRQYMSMPPVLMESSVPIILIPTTSGTGSEMTLFSILTNTDNNMKEAVSVCSALAIVDPELCRTVPPKVTAYSGFDALSHAIEAITARRRNPFSEHMAAGVVPKIMKYLPVAYQNGDDLEARAQLALASNWAGIALVDTDCHFGHCLAEGISAAFSLPHGMACALTLPGALRMAAIAVPEKLQLIGDAMGLQIGSGESIEVVESAVNDKLFQLMRCVGIKPLKELGYKRSDVVATAPIAAGNGMRFSSPMEINTEFTEDMLGWAYDAYQ